MTPRKMSSLQRDLAAIVTLSAPGSVGLHQCVGGKWRASALRRGPEKESRWHHVHGRFITGAARELLRELRAAKKGTR